MTTTTKGPPVAALATPAQRTEILAAAHCFLAQHKTEVAQAAEAAKAQQRAILMQGEDETCEGELVVGWTVSVIAWEELQPYATIDLRAAATERLGTPVCLVYEAKGVCCSDLLFVLTEEQEALAMQVRKSITLVLRRWQKLRVAPGWEILRERFIVLMKGDIETALRSLGMLKGLPAAQEHLASCGGWPEDLGPAPEWLGPPPPPEPKVH